MKLEHIHKAFVSGCKLHAFLSGGGLRVVRIEKNGTLKGYGEHPHIEEALAHADEDYAAGGRKYKDVYGEDKIHTHYLTGSSTTSSTLDSWVHQGRTFDVWQENESVVVQLQGYKQLEHPEDLEKKVLKDGKSRQFEQRGLIYEMSAMCFASGSPGISTKVVGGRESKNGADPWMWKITKTGKGKDFWAALEKAFKAESVEVK
jgi:hypothetical protein